VIEDDMERTEPLQIIPAVDVLDGAVVRLLRGDFDRVTRYDDDPVAVARHWVEEGAGLVHVVDLGAAGGGAPDRDLWRRLGAAGISFQVGGGIADGATAVAALEAGARRVVVGSAALRPDGTAAAIVDAVGADRVVGAIDVRDGRARGGGWRDAGVPLDVAVVRLVVAGIERVLVTGIERDGAMVGPDLGLIGDVAAIAPGVQITASGGVGDLGDLVAIAATGCEGVIVGRALYEGRFTLADALAAVGGR